jgi:hypothetical protein
MDVDAGYTFFAKDRHKVTTSVIVDTDVPPTVLDKQKSISALKMSKGTLANPPLANRLTMWMECSPSILCFTK